MKDKLTQALEAGIGALELAQEYVFVGGALRLLKEALAEKSARDLMNDSGPAQPILVGPNVGANRIPTAWKQLP